MPTTTNNNVIESQDLTGDPMSVFFTLTFANVLRKTCVECQDHFRDNGYSSHLKGDSYSGLKDVSFKYHSHFPSYGSILAVAKDLSDRFASKYTQIVVEGDNNYLKKINEYLDEHKIRPLFSQYRNRKVTRPHIHGFIKNIHVDHFHKTLEYSKYFMDFWQPGCECFKPEIVENSNWVYRSEYAFNRGRDVDKTIAIEQPEPYGEHIYPPYSDPWSYSNNPNKCKPHKYPETKRKPRGFYNIQKARNNEDTERYIQKYIDKGGSDVRLF